MSGIITKGCAGSGGRFIKGINFQRDRMNTAFLPQSSRRVSLPLHRGFMELHVLCVYERQGSMQMLEEDVTCPALALLPLVP